MDKKMWWESKTIWFNIVMTLLDIASLAEPLGVFTPQVMAFVHGVGNVILRIWLSDTVIEKKLL